MEMLQTQVGHLKLIRLHFTVGCRPQSNQSLKIIISVKNRKEKRFLKLKQGIVLHAYKPGT